MTIDGNKAIVCIERMSVSKQNWLNTFSSGYKKRPDHELNYERENLAVLTQTAQWLRDARDKKRGGSI